MLTLYKNIEIRIFEYAHEFQSESTLYICLNVKGLLARNRHDIWSLSEKASKSWGLGTVNANCESGLSNTNWCRGPAPEPRVRTKAGGQETQIPFNIANKKTMLTWVLRSYLKRSNAKKRGVFVSRPTAPRSAPGSNFYLITPALNLHLPALAISFYLPFFRFTVKVCYSQPRLHCIFSLFFQNRSGDQVVL